MIDLLITHGTIITMDPARRIIEDGAVAIRGEQIVAVDTTATLTARYSARRVIDAAHHAVLPGFIDAHAHAGHGLIKTMGSDDSDRWYNACELIYTRGSTPDFWYAESRLSALERLKAGTTLGVSYLGGGESFMATDEPAPGAAYCRAVEEVGTRALLAVGPGGPPFPRRYTRWDGDTPRHADVDHARQLTTCETLIRRHHGSAGGRIQLCLAFPTPKPGQFIPGTPAFGDLQARAAETRALSRRYGLLWTMDGHQQGTIRFCDEHLQLLGPDAFFSHCIDIDADEIARCRDSGTRVVHNPSAIFSIMGRCPVPELLDAGVTVMLGSDGTAPDRSYDMFRHMQQCIHYHRRHFRDPEVLPPGKVLEMITIDAARGLGLADTLGSLEAGKQADIILIDMQKPHLYPPVMPVQRLVYFANAADVATVIVAGKVRLEQRRAIGVDEAAVLAQAQEELFRALARTGLESYLQTRDNFWGKSHY